MNITDVYAELALTRPHHPAIEDGAHGVTYGDLAPAVDAAAANLRASGIAAGDIVAVKLADSPDHLIILCALARAGAIVFSLNSFVSKTDLDHSLGSVAVKALIARDAPDVAAGVLCLTPGDIRRPTSMPFERPDHSDDHPLVLNQSSGTTGAPKSFFRSHGEFLWWSRRYRRAQGWNPDDRCLSLTPLSFDVGRSISLDMLRLGATVVINRSTKPKEIVDSVHEKRITYLKLTPSHMTVLLAYGEDKPLLFPDLRAMVVGSAPVTNHQRMLARSRLTPNCFEQLGSNEAGLMAFATPADQDRYPDSVGRVIEGVEAEIVDTDGNALPAGEVGNVRFRAPGYPSRYLDDPEASRRAFRGGWFHPGDLAAMNEEGYLFLKGRADDVINNSGVKFYPVEVETVLLSHVGVTEAAVVDWPHALYGEVAVAFVVLNSQVALDELRDLCARRMAPFKVPHHLVAVSEMPKNPMGKILKGTLRQTLHDHLDTRKPGR